MKLITLAIALAIAAALCASPVAAQTSPNPTLVITPFDPSQGLAAATPGVIEIPPDDVETFWAHVYWDGHNGQRLRILEVSWHADIVLPTGATTVVEEWYAHQGDWVTVSQWFPWNKVHTIGKPCTYITFQADIVLADEQGNVYGPLWSNTITKHIVPEPSSLLAFGSGALGLVGFIFRRKR